MKKDKLVLVIIILLLVSSFILITIGDSYSFFTYSKKGATKNKIVTGIHDEDTLSYAIFQNNEIITDTPSLNTASNSCAYSTTTSSTTCGETADTDGLYKSTNTNDGSSTYYFRGNVTNNYVEFAGQTWRIVRINEDGTIRIVLQDTITSVVAFHPDGNDDYTHTYYSNTNISGGAKYTLEDWYNSNIAISTVYSDKVATGNYFCEQAKVSYNGESIGNAETVIYSSYTPNFKCETDANGYGLVNSNIGLLTYDEVVHAGGYYNTANSNYYLYNNTYWWTMSPNVAISSTGSIAFFTTTSFQSSTLHPTINLKSDVEATGSGTKVDPYVVGGETLKNEIFNTYTTIYDNPTLTDSSNNTSDASGLYKSTATNDGSPTYYFRGNVENNYVSFAGFSWRIVRINEDGTIRVVMQDGINDNTNYAFNSVETSKDHMYYSNSDTAKPTLETWYSTNIANNESYSSKVATGNYYCEQAKVALTSNYVTGSGADMTVYSSYTPNFKCETDANGYGLVNSNIGLLTYDEVVHAGGGSSGGGNDDYYLDNNGKFGYYYLMSPGGFFTSNTDLRVWQVLWSGHIGCSRPSSVYRLRPVLNLNADTIVTGLGTSTIPWKVVSS